MTRTICIYHANCADGFTAAWAVNKALHGVHFIPASYGDTPPDVTGADVILVDFSYKAPVLETMAKSARSVLVLDHHETAMEELEGFAVPAHDWLGHIVNAQRFPGTAYVEFDMARSGAQMAWDFFHGGGTRPALVEYVADRDLWQFKLPHSREISAWLASHPFDFGTLESCSNRLDDARLFELAVAEGEAILRKHMKDVEGLLEITRREMDIGGHTVPVANLPPTMASDAAGMMAEGQPFAATYYDRPDGRVFSLRAREGGVNVAQIAASFGGGGHAAAAGFSAPAGWEGDL
jgi:hypothetical protein